MRVAALFVSLLAAEAHLRVPSGAPAQDLSAVHDVSERKKLLAEAARPIQPVQKLSPQQVYRAEQAIKNADAEIATADADIKSTQQLLADFAKSQK